MWNKHNVAGAGNNPPHEGETGVLLIVGASDTTWPEVKKFLDLDVPAHVMAINHTIICWPHTSMFIHYPLKHAVCYDPGVVNHYRAIRKIRLKEWDIPLTHSCGPEADCIWRLTNIMHLAFTAAFATAIAIAMGYDKIILAGCGQSNNGHYFDPPWITHPEFDIRCYHMQWTDNSAIFKHKTRSMSGVTRELYGEPTIEWLKGE